jgi:hypothetical protein
MLNAIARLGTLSLIGFLASCTILSTLGIAGDREPRIAASSGPRPSPPIDIGSRRELFVDRLLIDSLDSATLRLHEPVSGGVAIRIDKPWEGPGTGGYAVVIPGTPMLLYYRAVPDEPDPVELLCVATSTDGITWTKPDLGLVEYAGRRDTNILCDEEKRPLLVAPWLDTRPGVPAAERIKAFYAESITGKRQTFMFDPQGLKRLVMLASADGLRFRRLDPQPRIECDLPNAFDGGNTMFWSEAEQRYVFYFRWYDGDYRLIDGKLGKGYRSVARMTSADFLSWTKAEPMDFGDTPRQQIYTNNTQPYCRAPHIYLAPAARLMQDRRAISDDEAEEIGLQTLANHRYAGDCADAVLLTARAGSTRYDREFLEAFIRPGLGLANWTSRSNFPVTGILSDGPDRVMMFVQRRPMQPAWHIERLVFRTDGFASVNAGWKGGSMLTKPLTFAGKALEINYRTSAAGSVRVEIQDADGHPFPGFAAADCPEIIGDQIDRIVTWSGSDLAALAGRPVRLRFELRDADLYSIRFREASGLMPAP